jgi:hypothetical protein
MARKLAAVTVFGNFGIARRLVLRSSLVDELAHCFFQAAFSNRRSVASETSAFPRVTQARL